MKSTQKFRFAALNISTNTYQNMKHRVDGWPIFALDKTISDFTQFKVSALKY